MAKDNPYEAFFSAVDGASSECSHKRHIGRIGRKMKLLLAAALAGLTLLAGCQEEPEEAANKLFVETVSIWDKYQALPAVDPAHYEDRVSLLAQVAKNLDTIVTDYAESSLAVEMVSGDKLRNIDNSEIEKEKNYISKELFAYVVELTKREEFDKAVATSDGIFDIHKRFLAISEIARAQIESGDNKDSIETLSAALRFLGDENFPKKQMDAALLIVAKMQNDAGENALARDTIQKIEDQNWKSYAYEVIQ